MEADYVIVGAGSAGCALAGRLASRTSDRIALLEAGPRDRNIWVHVPVGYARTKSAHAIGWGYVTEPEPDLGGRRIAWPRGRVLGGSSAINGLLYIRGHRDDFEDWVRMGADGWGWSDMLPIFRRMEDNERGEDEFHGRGGPLSIVDLRPKHPLMDAYIRAAAGVGLKPTQDFNGPEQDGIGYFQLTIRDGWRCSAATAYGINGKPPKNLSVVTDAQAARVIFAGRKATGVELVDGRTIVARREVILCAGAIGSPQLLELSGVGDPALLGGLGIAPVHANPAVGENLQDHFQVKLVFRMARPNTINDVLNHPLRKSAMVLEFALRRTGLMTTGSAQVCAFARVAPGATRPDMQIHASPASTDDPSRGMDPFPGLTSSVSQMRPESRGSIHIASNKPQEPPKIRANYLAAEADRTLFVDSVRLARAIVRQPAMAEDFAAELKPGDEVQSDDEILDFVRRTGSTNYHPVGTCRIGPEGEGVVDAELRVRGVEGLRVADASVMPVIVSGNTNAASIAIGEKLADILTGRVTSA